MNFTEFLFWAFSGGGNILIASFLFERWSWYQSLTKEQKDWTFFGVSSLISIVAYLGITYVPAEVITQITPYFSILYLTFAYKFLGSAANKIDKKSKPAG